MYFYRLIFRKINLIACIILSCFLNTPAHANLNAAFDYLARNFDQYHTQFYIYKDAEAGGNHYEPSGKLGDIQDIGLTTDSGNNPHSGNTCIEIRYHPMGQQHWAGIYWQHPRGNWGEKPGFDLSGATTLRFFARGAAGGEKAEFKVGGIGTPQVQSTGILTLSADWQQYTISLKDIDLKNLIGGFAWTTNAELNSQGAVIYVDDISIDVTHLDALRFLQSYETDPKNSTIKNHTAFLYDNALALLAFLSRAESKDLEIAKILADTLVFAQQHDRYFTDGRWRNAYRTGDIIDSETHQARLPSWWHEEQKKNIEYPVHTRTDIGNVAWAMIALLQAHQQFKNPQYLASVVAAANWIETEARDERGAGGYILGFDGGDDQQRRQQHKSTEHNIDLYIAFARLHQVTQDKKWAAAARHARQFVEAMWNQADGYFWTGTNSDGATIVKTVIPVDIQAWVIMTLYAKNDPKYAKGMAWVEKNAKLPICPTCEVQGYDFNQDKDGIWYEGTAQVALAWEILGEHGKYQELADKTLVSGQEASGGIYAALPLQKSCVSTGFDWCYYHAVHVGATSWAIFAWEKWNPYWGKSVEALEKDGTDGISVK